MSSHSGAALLLSLACYFEIWQTWMHCIIANAFGSVKINTGLNPGLLLNVSASVCVHCSFVQFAVVGSAVETCCTEKEHWIHCADDVSMHETKVHNGVGCMPHFMVGLSSEEDSEMFLSLFLSSVREQRAPCHRPQDIISTKRERWAPCHRPPERYL